MFGDKLGGRDRLNLEMHCEIVIDRVSTYTGGHYCANLQAIIVRDWGYTWRA